MTSYLQACRLSVSAVCCQYEVMVPEDDSSIFGDILNLSDVRPVGAGVQLLV